MRPSPPLGTTRGTEYSPGGVRDGARRRARLVSLGSQNPSRLTTSTGAPSAPRPPAPPSAAAAGPPAVLDAGRTTELTAGEPGPHAATRTPRLNERLGAGTQGRCLRPGRPKPPSAH